ncbi:MAG: hypothetical protein U0L26_05985 [Cellulosilyticum sp.]|nr:hypothetical protein [Cellulosilyticum sp.]
MHAIHLGLEESRGVTVSRKPLIAITLTIVPFGIREDAMAHQVSLLRRINPLPRKELLIVLVMMPV